MRKIKAWWLRQIARTSSGKRLTKSDSMEIVKFVEFLKKEKKTGKQQRENTYKNIYK